MPKVIEILCGMPQRESTGDYVGKREWYIFGCRSAQRTIKSRALVRAMQHIFSRPHAIFARSAKIALRQGLAIDGVYSRFCVTTW